MKDFELRAYVGMPVTIVTPKGNMYHGNLGVLRSEDHVFCLSKYELLEPKPSYTDFRERGVNHPSIFSNGYRIIFDRAPDVEIEVERTIHALK